MTKRKAIPKDIRNELLVDAMHRCCLCPEHHEVVDLHHVVPISEGGPNTKENLMAVCPTCHAKIHRIRNRYTIDQLRMYKERWVRLCALGLPLELRVGQAFDYTQPPKSAHMSPGIPAPPVPFIAHPYAAEAHFTGRAEERAELTKWLQSGDHPLLALTAIGGMGKSALTWRWLQHDVLADGGGLDGVLWWSFYDRESSFERFLERAVAYASGGEIGAADWTTREWMECLRMLLSEKRFLLVLDGVERLLRAYARMDGAFVGDEPVGAQTSLGGISPRQCVDYNAGLFLQWLAGSGPSRTLLTSRLFPCELEGLAGARRRVLEQMPPDDAVRFFRAVGIQGTRAEIEAACRPYGYLPLALRLLAGLVLEDPARSGDIAVATDYEITDALRGKERHHVLERAYDALGDDSRALLSRIAALRSSVAYETLEALFGPGGAEEDQGEGFRFSTRRDLKDALRSLVKRGLTQRQEAMGRYDLHPVVRGYAYDRLADKEEAHARLRDFFAALPEPEYAETLADLAVTIELYHHTVRSGEYDDACELYRRQLDEPLYFRFEQYGLVIELLSAVFPRCVPISPSGRTALPRLSDDSWKGWALNSLAAAYARSGQPWRAVPILEAAVALAEEQGHTKNVAIGLGNLAAQQLVVGALAAAEWSLRRQIALCCGIERVPQQAVGQREFGRLLAYCGAFKEAEQFLTAAVLSCGEVHRIQSEGIGWAYRALLALLMKDLDAAVEAARRAQQLADEAARTRYEHERDSIRAQWLLGAALHAQGALGQAAPNLHHALRRCRRIKMVDHEPCILLALARLRHDQAAQDSPPDPVLLAEAQSLAEEALIIANRCACRLFQADCYNFLAQLTLEEGAVDEARRHGERARERAWCDGPPHRYEVAFQKAEHLLAQIEGTQRPLHHG